MSPSESSLTLPVSQSQTTCDGRKREKVMSHPSQANTAGNVIIPVTGDETFPLVTDAERTEPVTAPTTAAPKAEAPKPAAVANGKTNPNKPAPKAVKPPKAAKVVAGKPLEVVAVPKEKESEVALKDLVFAKAVQMRSGIFDDATVEKYRAYYEDDAEAGVPDRMPPMRVIRITEAEAKECGLGGTLIVWDGFQRGEALLRAKRKTVKVRVADGDFQTAKLLALQANADHGQPRSIVDLKRLFVKLLDDESLLAEVLSKGVGNGGAQRALAVATKLSKGSVYNVLKSMGKATRGDKIHNIAEVAPRAKPARVDPQSTQLREDPATIAKKNTAVIIQEMVNCMAAMQRRYESLFEREDALPVVLETAKTGGVPIRKDENPSQKPGDKRTTVKVTYHWPAVDDLFACMEDIKKAHAETVTKPTK